MKKLNPKAVYLFFFNFLLRLAVPIIPIFIYASIVIGPLSKIERAQQALNNNASSYGLLSPFGVLDWLWLIIPIYIILCYVWAELSYRFYRYEVLDNGFRKESGVITKKYVTIPYDRIQNVNINRGVAARILGLSDLSIETAGLSAVTTRYGYTAEGRLPGLSIQVAEQLRDELIERARKSKNQGL